MFRTVGQPIRVDVYAELVAAFAATAIMLRSIDQRGWDGIDLSLASAKWRAMAMGLVAGGAPIALVCGALLATGLMHFVAFPAETAWMGAAFRIAPVLVPAALAEELICRGYLLTVAREAVGVRAAVAGTSVMFGLLHIASDEATVMSVAIVTLAGLLLATVRLATNSLYAAWMAHFAWNWVMAALFHAPVSGQEFEAPGYRAVTTAPAWLSGGVWGPEGGIMAALGLIGALGFFYVRQRREES
ncbi:MAG: CPBP family intramembrane glutamic endopeptidase [Gemmatimonadaceae bacterium]